MLSDSKIIVSGRTGICGVIGDPVEHSVSPAMQNAAFKHAGLNFVYVPFRVKKEDLTAAVAGVRALGIHGLNITIPHKVNIIPLLDAVDELAAKIGSVNVIVNEAGRLKGYNTDGAGFIQVLTEKGINLRDKKVTVVGAGGAARAIIFALVQEGARITILNRSERLRRAVDISVNIARVFSSDVRTLELNEANLAGVMKDTEILVNATSVGMTPFENETPVDRSHLKRGMLVYDIVYNPVKTRLLKEAAAAGSETINGLEMLVRQGALSFEIWTGKPAPVNIMRRAAQKELSELSD